jgi:phosphatidylinositol alpha-1,6-mannosyltransferase
MLLVHDRSAEIRRVHNQDTPDTQPDGQHRNQPPPGIDDALSSHAGLACWSKESANPKKGGDVAHPVEYPGNDVQILPEKGHSTPVQVPGRGLRGTPLATVRGELASVPNEGILLVSELFPPDVGGTAEVFGNTYGRFTGIPSAVLTRRATHAGKHLPGISSRIHGMRMRFDQWGVMHPVGLTNHIAVARQIRRLAGRHMAAVHCARVLPEGLSAMLASLAGAPAYACWAHGEELAYIDSSRELRALASGVFSRTRAVIANSENTASLVVKRGVPVSKVHPVRLGVDADRFRPCVPGARELRQQLAPDAQFVCLTVGRLQRRKGHDLVIEALASIGKAASIKYIIVGSGEERARLEALVADRGLTSVVVFAGRVAFEDLPRYYAAADLFLHPNRVDQSDFEGFGVVFLEAAASGLPAIGGRSGGVPEAIVDGLTGVLVGGNDVSELQSAMTTLLNAPDVRRSMGLAARARATAEFTWEQTAARVAELHRQLFR